MVKLLNKSEKRLIARRKLEKPEGIQGRRKKTVLDQEKDEWLWLAVYRNNNQFNSTLHLSTINSNWKFSTQITKNPSQTKLSSLKCSLFVNIGNLINVQLWILFMVKILLNIPLAKLLFIHWNQVHVICLVQLFVLLFGQHFHCCSLLMVTIWNPFLGLFFLRHQLIAICDNK